MMPKKFDLYCHRCFVTGAMIGMVVTAAIALLVVRLP
jgi:hypothetical protein